MPKIDDNGTIRDMTDEELAGLPGEPQVEMTPEARMDQIEAALIELAALATAGAGSE